MKQRLKQGGGGGGTGRNGGKPGGPGDKPGPGDKRGRPGDKTVTFEKEKPAKEGLMHGLMATSHLGGVPGVAGEVPLASRPCGSTTFICALAR